MTLIKVKLEKFEIKQFDLHISQNVSTMYNFLFLGVRFSLAESQVKGGGIVVLSVDGKEGTVCGNGWSNLDAQVFCRQSGYVTGLSYT